MSARGAGQAEETRRQTLSVETQGRAQIVGRSEAGGGGRDWLLLRSRYTSSIDTAVNDEHEFGEGQSAVAAAPSE